MLSGRVQMLRFNVFIKFYLEALYYQLFNSINSINIKNLIVGIFYTTVFNHIVTLHVIVSYAWFSALLKRIVFSEKDFDTQFYNA